LLTAADNVSDFRGTIAAEAVFTLCARKLLAQAPRAADPEIDIVRCALFHRHQVHYRNATLTQCEKFLCNTLIHDITLQYENLVSTIETASC